MENRKGYNMSNYFRHDLVELWLLLLRYFDIPIVFGQLRNYFSICIALEGITLLDLDRIRGNERRGRNKYCKYILLG